VVGRSRVRARARTHTHTHTHTHMADRGGDDGGGWDGCLGVHQQALGARQQADSGALRAGSPLLLWQASRRHPQHRQRRHPQRTGRSAALSAHLDLDVARPRDVALQQHAVVVKRGRRLAARRVQRGTQLRLRARAGGVVCVCVCVCVCGGGTFERRSDCVCVVPRRVWEPP
jgi:hypothetical protein